MRDRLCLGMVVSGKRTWCCFALCFWGVRWRHDCCHVAVLYVVHLCTDHPEGSAVRRVVAEANGQAVACVLAYPGFADGVAEVIVAGLAPATLYSLRCRCEVVDADVDPDSLWTPSLAVTTAAGDIALEEEVRDVGHSLLCAVGSIAAALGRLRCFLCL